MIQETILFDIKKRWVPDRACVDDLCSRCSDPPYVEGVFTDYLADYCGIMRQEKPKRFFEIGVRYGYTAIAMLQARYQMAGQPKAEFLGIDDESYHYMSCTKANQNFEYAVPWAKAHCLRWNSMTQGMPPDCGMFDLCHIDGNKDYAGRAGDLAIVWPHLNPGGFIILDDAAQFCDDGSPGPTYAATMDFLKQFENSDQLVYWQYSDKVLTHHLYIRKAT